MKLLSLLIFLSLFIPCSFCQTNQTKDTCCFSKLREQGIQNAPIESLSSEFKRLKSLKNTCCNKWNSDLHQIISTLTLLLGKEGTSVALLTQYMGKPDANEKKLPDGIVQLQKGERIMIYFWRGYHDFVYFVYQDGKVKFAKWFMWGE